MTNGDPQEWLVHAESDLRIAKLGRKDPEVLLNQIAFHAQQAVEKTLKAVLIQSQVNFPKTHDLKELLLLVQQTGRVWPSEFEKAKVLTPFAVQTRYPGYDAEITQSEVDEAIQLAERVIAWAKGEIS